MINELPEEIAYPKEDPEAVARDLGHIPVNNVTTGPLVHAVLLDEA